MRIISGKARGTKLYTLENLATRPTLDRVKESIFNIIQNDIREARILDLFAGSGAIGLEAISRGASYAVLCDQSKDAVNIIRKNIEKTHFEEFVKVYNSNYVECLKKVEGQVFDVIYLDPPYKTDYAVKAVEKIINLQLINEDSTIIIETDEEQKVLKDLEKIKNIKMMDQRKYGRANIIFLKLA